MPYFGHLAVVRLIVQRGLALIYLLAFLGVDRQFPALLGEHGLLPAAHFLRRRRFRDSPSLFHWHYSDRALHVLAWCGVALSLGALSGLAQSGPLWLCLAVWLALWVLYLSVVNVGQTFFGFGWESMLLEAGFFAAFLGPARMAAPLIPILILRWMLFRTELGAGLIKLRHDPCWRELTCLDFHYETQPLPNPLSAAFHRLPKPAHRVSVLASHFIQIIAPWGLFLPQPIASICGGLAILQQLLLIVSGNYAWLNWLTVVLGFTAFSDATLHLRAGPAPQPVSTPYLIFLALLALAAALASIEPTRNLFSRRQKMNHSYNPLHLVNTYGAFGSVTRVRYEVVIEGCADPVLTSSAPWLEYGCKAKPGDVRRRPPQIAPYHLRLDWMLWFLPFSVTVTRGGISVPGHELWFIALVRKLLQGDAGTRALFHHPPFRDQPPRYIRALFYRYRFTTPAERRATGAWWSRELLGTYLPPLSLRFFAAAASDDEQTHG